MAKSDAIKRRFDAMKRTGCIPCLLENLADSHGEIHHIVDGAYRQGDQFTYSNCSWHHRGIPWQGMELEDMRHTLGPSLRLQSRDYRERYGDEGTLLQVQNYVLHLFATEPWADYDMPRETARKVRKFWKEKRKRYG